MAERDNSSGLMEEVLTIRMHTKVTKGGRNLTFAALVAVGDGKGRVGLGYGKAPGVPQAIEKANKRARQDMIEVPLIGDTLSHEQIGEHKSSRVLLKPAAPGTGVKAGGAVRSILLVLGVHNALTKSLGRNNPINLALATMDGLTSLRPRHEAEQLRGRPIALKHPQLNVSETQDDAEAAVEDNEAKSAESSEAAVENDEAESAESPEAAVENNEAESAESPEAADGTTER